MPLGKYIPDIPLSMILLSYSKPGYTKVNIIIAPHNLQPHAMGQVVLKLDPLVLSNPG